MAATVRQVGYEWKLRAVMADHEMFNTTDLIPHLAERGIELSAVQVYRLVAQTPERLNLQVLAAVCDIFDCAPGELIEPTAQTTAAAGRRAAGSPNGGNGGDNGGGEEQLRGRRPTRARIVDDDEAG